MQALCGRAVDALLRREPGGEAIDNLAELVHLEELFDRQVDHRESLVSIDELDEAFVLQHAQRFSQRGTADTELFRQARLQEPEAGRERSVEDQIPQPVCDFVDEPRSFERREVGEGGRHAAQSTRPLTSWIQDPTLAGCRATASSNGCEYTANARFDIDMAFPVPLDELASFVPAFNANGPVNAIPYVGAAPPGILTTEDLPHIVPRGPRRAER